MHKIARLYENVTAYRPNVTWWSKLDGNENQFEYFSLGIEVCFVFFEYVVNSFCVILQDILENPDVKLDHMFIASLVADIVKVRSRDFLAGWFFHYCRRLSVDWTT